MGDENNKKLKVIERDQMIQETHDTVLKLETVLVGLPGTKDTGLVGKVEKMCDSHDQLEKAHNKTRVILCWLIGVLAGAGVLTGAGFGIADLVKAGG